MGARGAVFVIACRDASLAAWQLYLVDWGYNTPDERARAAAHPRITVIDVKQFQMLMQGGDV